MPYETINTHEAVNLFRQLMQPSSQMRVLRLVGETKIGKSHLLTKVFPILAREEYQAHYAILDLRNPAHTIPDLLSIACGQFGAQVCNDYNAAFQDWAKQPKVGITQLLAIFSRINISTRDSHYDACQRDRHLTSQFVKDLAKFDDKPLLFLFDTIDSSTTSIQTWLMGTFLALLHPLPHVRVVIAGRCLPKAYGNYAVSSWDYQLEPVKDMEAYMTYCHTVNARLPEQTIRVLASASLYTPGFFVELAHNFLVAGRTQ